MVDFFSESDANLLTRSRIVSLILHGGVNGVLCVVCHQRLQRQAAHSAAEAGGPHDDVGDR